jgi:hypothetical protein
VTPDPDDLARAALTLVRDGDPDAAADLLELFDAEPEALDDSGDTPVDPPPEVG